MPPHRSATTVLRLHRTDWPSNWPFLLLLRCRRESELHGGVPSGFRQRVLPEHVSDPVVPGGDVHGDCGADRLHHIRVRGDGQRVELAEGDEPSVFGVLLGGLLEDRVMH